MSNKRNNRFVIRAVTAVHLLPTLCSCYCCLSHRAWIPSRDKQSILYNTLYYWKYLNYFTDSSSACNKKMYSYIAASLVILIKSYQLRIFFTSVVLKLSLMVDVI